MGEALDAHCGAAAEQWCGAELDWGTAHVEQAGTFATLERAEEAEVQAVQLAACEEGGAAAVHATPRGSSIDVGYPATGSCRSEVLRCRRSEMVGSMET